MTKEQHGKLADFYYEAYLTEKTKPEPDEFMVKYHEDMMLFNEDKSGRYKPRNEEVE